MVKFAPLSLKLTKFAFKEFEEKMKGAGLMDARGRIDWGWLSSLRFLKKLLVAKPVSIVCMFGVYKQNIAKFVF
jgi:hypothetical protein